MLRDLNRHWRPTLRGDYAEAVCWYSEDSGNYRWQSGGWLSSRIEVRVDMTALRVEQLGASISRVDYEDEASVGAALEGIDVILSFIGNALLKKMFIAAAISDDVTRFVPNEWAMSSLTRESCTEYKVQPRESRARGYVVLPGRFHETRRLATRDGRVVVQYVH